MGRLSRQQLHRKRFGTCFFCGESRPELLDTHRLFGGEHGGVYDKNGRNLATLCGGCHRKVTEQVIKMDVRKYLRSDGRWAIRYWEDGREVWKTEQMLGQFGPGGLASDSHSG